MNVGTVRTNAQYFHDRLLQNEMPASFRYNGTIIGDASPAATELFMNGEAGSRMWLPKDSYTFGTFIGCAWNLTLGDAPAGIIAQFGIENDNDTVAFAPTNLSGADGNPVSQRLGEAGTWALVAENTLKALVIRFTPTANHTYIVTGQLQFAFAGAKSRFSNNNRQTI
jgi:hypothetical protein